ncbi:MAG: hypothetical protein K5696_12730 [Lachnospiraceae bacterium]|nr:hypothetical protein [Lachnospiraceae bacterium]
MANRNKRGGGKTAFERVTTRTVMGAAVLFALPMIFVRFSGKETVTILAFPLILLFTLYLISEVIWERPTFRGVRLLLKGDQQDAARQYRRHMSVFGAAFGAVLSLAGVFLQPIFLQEAAGRAGNGRIFLVLMPGMVLLGSLGGKKGYLRACGAGAEVSLLSMGQNVLTLVLPCLLSILLSRFGVRVDALMQTDCYAAIYGAAGTAIGLDIACLASWIAFFLMELRFRAPDFFAGRRGKGRSGYPYLSMDAVFPLLLLAVLSFDLWRYFHGMPADEEGAAAHYALWGRYLGTAWYPSLFAGTLAVIPFILSVLQVQMRVQRDDSPSALDRFAGMIRHACILFFPMTLLISALALPINRGLFGQTDAEGAALLGWQILMLPFFSISVLLTILLYKSGGLRVILIGAGIATAAHIAAVLLIPGGEHPVMPVIVAHLIGMVLYALIVFVLLSAMLSYRQEWIHGVLIPLLSAGVATLPVFLLSRILAEVVGEILTIVILSVMAGIIYMLLLTILHGITEYELYRIPGGRLLAGFTGHDRRGV